MADAKIAAPSPRRSTLVGVSPRILLVFLIGAVSTSIGCGPPQGKLKEPPAPEVAVAAVVAQDVTEYSYFTGRIAPVESVELHARVAGYLVKADFEEGSEVEAGTALFEIDPRPFQAAVEAAKATVARWDATLAKAQADLQRNQQLAASGAVSKEELDLSVAEVKVAQAELKGANEAVRKAELDLGYTVITAPISGRVGRKLVTVGNLVSANANQSPLTTLVSVDPMHVYFAIDEPTLVAAQARAREKNTPQDIEAAQIKVDVAIAGSHEYKFQGVIDFIDNRVDPSTATIQVRAVLPNQERMLTAGLFARVRVSTGAPRPEILVDERAIGTDLNQRFVYIVNGEDTVEYRAVELGPKQESGLRVVRPPTGQQPALTAQDRVIVEGIQRVRPGIKVRPKAVASAAGNAT